MQTNGPDYTRRDIRRLILAWLDANNLQAPHTDLTPRAIEALVTELSKLVKAKDCEEPVANPTAHDEMIRLSDRLGEAERRIAELEKEMRATLKWARRMGYIDLQDRLGKLLGEGSDGATCGRRTRR